jgi:subtilisin family serine protease
MRNTILISLIVFFALCVPQASLAGTAGRSHPQRLIVKFHADGDQALLECAVRLERSGRTFASATRDGSEALDELRKRFGVRRTRALFREADERPFEAQRRSARARLQGVRGRQARGRAARGDRPLPELSHVYSVEIASSESVAEAVAAFEADPHVAWAQPDHLNDLDQVVFDDPFLHSFGSWGFDFEDLWGLSRIRADVAWEQSMGEGVVVAVVDTGLDYLHPDIADNVFVHPGEDLNGNGVADPEEWNGLDDDGNGFVDDLHGFDFAGSIDANEDGDYLDPSDVSDSDPWDDNGHGTHVAGTIAAVGNNGIGIAGVAPRARIMALKGFPAEGPGLDSVLWRAALYAVQNGARVINNSWSCRGRCPRNPLGEEMTKTIHALGGVIVTSAGNSRDDVAFKSPEHLYETITVGSSGEDDIVSETFSNFGLNVDVAAPGGGPVPLGGPRVLSPHKNILSLRAIDAVWSEGLSVGGEYARNAGTSMAAPHVSGVAALLLGLDPDLDYASIKTSLRLGAIDLGAPGHDPLYGAGRLDAPGALLAMSDAELAFTGPRPMTSLDPLSGPHAVEARIDGAAIEGVELSYGVGLQPTHWEPLSVRPDRAVERSGTQPPFHQWQTAELDDGAYTLRLEAILADGRTTSEFLHLSLERHAPMQLSRLPGSMPAVSRGRVVYETTDPETRETDLRLVDVRSGRDVPLVAAAGSQRDADIDGRVVAWREGSRGDAQAPIRACSLVGGPQHHCEPFTVTDADSARERPTVSRGRLYWGELNGADADVFSCAIAGRSCEIELFQGGPGSQRTPAASKESVAWLSSSSGQLNLEYCLLGSPDGDCPARPVLPERFVYTPPALGDDLLAWEQFGFPDSEIWLCPLDVATGQCPARRIAGGAADASPAFSGRRLVFAGKSPDGNREVWLCEWDRLLDDCALQRLTGNAGSQSRPDIDGDLVVWEDDRLGETHIFGLYLPTLGVRAPAKARVGTTWRARLAATHRMHASPSIEATLADGRPLEAIGARLLVRRDGRADLLWRPPRDHVGTHRITFRARSASGLTSQETIEITVEPRLRPRQWSLWRWWQSWVASDQFGAWGPWVVRSRLSHP